MKKFILPALVAALLLPALPGGAQLPGSTPTPTPTPTVTPTASASPAAATLAQATPTQIYAGRTATRGLSITLAGQGLQAGITTSRIASGATESCTGVACATAAGAAEPLGTTVTAMSPGTENPPPAESGNLDPLAQALAGTFGVATAMTTATPSATGTASGVNLDVTLTQSVVGSLPPELTEGLNGGLGQIADALQPIADGDPTGAIAGVTDQLTSLIGDLQSGPLLRIQGGQSTSSSSIAAGKLTATSQSEGVILVVLPTPGSTALLPEGLAVIEIGASRALATADGTNPATADAAASIGRITLLPGILDFLPDIDPSGGGGLPALGDILDMLPPEITDLLPGQVTDLLGGGGASEDPTAEPTSTEEGGPTGTPIDEILPTFMQADPSSGGFVINLATGTEQTCILEDTPLATCVTLGGTSQTFSDDNLGVGVLAAGADISLLRDANGVGQLELSVARSEAGTAAEFTQITPTTPPTTPPIPQTGMPSTGGGTAMVVPALALMAVGGTALLGLRRRRGEI